MNRITKAECEQIIAYAKPLLEFARDGIRCVNYQILVSDIEARFGISNQRARHAVSTAIIRRRSAEKRSVQDGSG